MLRQRGHSDGRAREEFDRLIEAARTTRTSPYLVEKIVLAAYTGLRRGSLFNLKVGSDRLRQPRDARSPARANAGGQQVKKGNLPIEAIGLRSKCLTLLGNLAPRAGLEPATLRLTAGCSAIELPRNREDRSYVFYFRRTTRPFSPPVIQSCTQVPIAPSTSHAIGSHL